MTRTEASDRAGARRSRSVRAAPAAIIAGGLLMAALFVAFTAAHGPTSVNEEREVLSWDMHTWGLLLGVAPNLLIAGGLWRLREWLAGGRRAAAAVVVAGCVALVLDAAMNLAFRALGPPFALFLLAPATIALAGLIPAGGAAGARTRVAVAGLGVILAAGLALALIPQEASDSFGGYRVFGTVVYGLGGVAWVLLGLSLARDQRGQPGIPT